MDPKKFSCVGIDGCKNGWVAVRITGTNFEVSIFHHIEEICKEFDDVNTLIIDMPIGLPETMGEIRPEGMARNILKGKASSIFNVPCRQAVHARTYEEANEINKEVLGKGLSRQSFNISPKMKEIDEYLAAHPQFKNQLLEGHPELCFAMLNSGVPLFENKKTYEGVRKRIELLSRYYEKTEELIAYVSGHDQLKTMMDDVMDAFCLAVTGMLSLEKGLKRIPESPMEDKWGILMQMVYAGK